jgi:TolB-like protein
MRSLALAAALLSTAALANEPKRVLVLYFDNNTSNRSYDVLGKGLADMFVTDLSAVEDLQVVEREKLQALIEEQKLQRSKFFDPKTAQKLGKGLGAEYAVTGALAELDPAMRIDIRLIEISSGKVVFGEKVSGKKDAFFDLQQELVDRFVKALDVKLKASARARSGETDVDTLLKYSQGIDAADKGDLKTASAALAEVVRDAPDFKLGKERYASLLRKMEEAGKKRTGLLNALEEEALAECERETARGIAPFLPTSPAKDDSELWKWRNNDALNRYLAFRTAKANLYLAKLLARVNSGPMTMTGGHFIRDGDRGEVLQLLGLMFASMEALISDLRTLMEKQPLLTYKNLYGRLPEASEERFKKLDVSWAGALWGDSLAQLESSLGFFSITGKSPSGWPGWFNCSPTHAMMDKAVVKPSLGHLDHAVTMAKREKEADAVAILDEYGEALLALGRKEEAVARWQQVLDGYPTHRSYKEIEKKIKEALCATDDCKAFEVSVQKCDANLMMKGGQYLPTLAHNEGSAGLRRVFEAVKKCPKKDPMYPQSPYNITAVSTVQLIGMQAQGIADCKLLAEAKDWLHANGGDMQVSVLDNYAACK